MSEVEVNSESISKLIKLCAASQSELEKTTTSLQKQYKELGANWKDNKYKEFGEIIDKCCSVLQQPLSGLKQCVNFLQQLFIIISEYDNIHFSNRSSDSDTSSSILGDDIQEIIQPSSQSFDIGACNNALAQYGNMQMVDISGIDMSADLSDGLFWRHHDCTEESWERVMSEYNAMMHDFSNGMSLDACYDRYPSTADVIFRDPIVLSNNNGWVLVIGGRHRIAMAQRLGITHLPAIVY